MNQKADLPPPSAAGEANQNTSSSSSSSSSLSPPAFIKNINAVFKRHRPLGTNVYRASRVLVSQADPPAASGPIAGNNISKRSYLAGTSIGAARVPSVDLDLRKNPPDGSSITPPSVPGAVNTRHGGDAAMVADRDCLTFQSYNARMTETRVGDISSHFRSLALTEGEGHHNYDAVMNPNQGHPQSMIVYGHGGSSAAASLLERREELRHDQHSMDPATRSSVMGTTCVTAMSLHSGPSASAGQTAFATQMSRQDDTVPEGQGAASREGDGLRDHKQVPQPGTSIKENNVSSNLSHLHSQAPLTTNIPSQNEPSHSSKAEKAPRKKKYDPDVFFKVNGKLYQRLGKIGSGGSSEVHKVITSDCTIYALKKINLKGRDYPTAYGFCQEIEYLNRMKGKNNIIQLIDYEVTDKTLLQGVMDGSMVSTREGRIKDDQYIYMVLEYGEIDLAHMLSHKWKGMDNSSWKIDENWLRFYWQQMLEAVNEIHNERIVHSDLKPANFLLVRGSLKLIDFGIAKAILSDTTNIQRDAQVGTLNYMSPEAFMWNEQDANGNTIKCGRPSDIWSLGCILYQMVYGKTPFAEYNTFWAKFKVITDRNHEIVYEPVSNLWLVDLMQKCLAWDRNERWRIPQLLQHPFLAPPVPRGVPGPSLVEGEHPCRILMEQVGVYWDDPEVSRLCSELREVVANLEKEKKDSAL